MSGRRGAHIKLGGGSRRREMRYTFWVCHHFSERGIFSESCLSASILQVDRSLQELVTATENASSLSEMMLIAWRLARRLAVVLVEEELAKQAQRPTEWPTCERCGKKLENKEFRDRELTGLIGTVHWKRRVGCCPDGCEIGQVAPLDEELGLQPNQRTSAGLKRAA
jgi:hypothetical protein